ncbi:MAG: hypothetical protein HYY18_17240 [Planctomycetes bacterium]|nr:hypothetical protein [Planctomycetota bacterium]
MQALLAITTGRGGLRHVFTQDGHFSMSRFLILAAIAGGIGLFSWLNRTRSTPFRSRRR